MANPKAGELVGRREPSFAGETGVSPGRAIIALGIVIVLAGALVEYAPALRLGRLPGDFTFGTQSFRIFVPLGTSVVLSILLTIILALMNRR